MAEPSPSSLERCPVPTEQQPLNEYAAMQEAWLFRWVGLGWRPYLGKLLGVWAIAWLVSGPVAAGSFAPGRSPGHFVLSAAGGAAVFVVLLLVRLYSGWGYVRDRLERPTILYEESGWYDGQEWPKPEAMHQRDQLVARYQVQPRLDRLAATLGGLGAATLLGTVLWFIV